jgi:hypothetical protein
MSQNKPLESQDFPLETKNKTIIKGNGDKIADAKDEQTAGEIRDRVNADHHREEEDRWA